MYVGLRTFYPKKGSLEKVLEMLQEVIRAAESEQGFQGAYCLWDENEQKILGIGAWDSKEDADNYEKKRTPGDKVSEVNAHLEELLAQPSTREVFSVPFMFEKGKGFICCQCNPFHLPKAEKFVCCHCKRAQ